MTGTEYDRGHVAGGHDARLDGHDRRLAAINGSIDHLGQQVTGLRLDVQALTVQALAAATTATTVAQALKDKSEQAWSPFAKVIAAVGAVVALVGLYLGFGRG
jgi:hypothetical protein